MKERPILFSAPMVRAILSGVKTQTRRTKKPQFGGDAEPLEMCKTTPEGWQTIGHSGRWWDAVESDDTKSVNCPYGIPGDRLWVRETWADVTRAFQSYDQDEMQAVAYRADDSVYIPGGNYLEQLGDSGIFVDKWKPSIFLPRYASRLTLEVIAVRVERLQDIKITDAAREGFGLSVENFKYGWQQINGVESWEANPWVWAIEFQRLEDK